MIKSSSWTTNVNQVLDEKMAFSYAEAYEMRINVVFKPNWMEQTSHKLQAISVKKPTRIKINSCNNFAQFKVDNSPNIHT